MEAEIGIIGGSGFYSLLEGAESVDAETEYGKPSDKISVGTLGGKKVAFIPRHGSKHTIPPHMVPYRANIAALHDLGVKRIIATSACGSLSREFRLGQIVFFDQFINMTSGRSDTFFDKDQVGHVSTADPYCRVMRARASSTATVLGIDHRTEGSVLVINGPRFSTKAESMFFAGLGINMLNMTQYPEVALAREKAMCYLGIGIVTDYDAGVVAQTGIAPVSYDEISRVFNQNVEKVKSLLKAFVEDMPKDRECACKDALDGAMVKV
jgi:5'-methylthioadenosine phosphorylase